MGGKVGCKEEMRERRKMLRDHWEKLIWWRERK